MAEEVLFNGNSVLDLAHAYPRHAVERAGRFTESELLNNSTDHLLNIILAEYALDVPVLLEDEVWIDEKEIESVRRPSRNDYGFDRFQERRGNVKEHFVVFHLPFRGDRDIFRFEPSSRTLSGLKADIGASELVLNFHTAGRDQQRIRADIDEAIAEIRRHLDRIRLDVRNVPSQIDEAVRHWIEQRKATLLKQKGTVAALGFPMKKRPEAPTTYRAPEVRRRIAPAVVKPAADAPFKPEPTMDEADYKHILSIIENMTTVMERSPSAFKGMGEEDIRSHYLVQLNGQYEGGATGETFNAAGKTDILVRSDNANIFIAECKIWRGEKVMSETVDQLLSYVTWRDTKTAIIVFNRNKDFSAVIDAAKRAIEAHPQYRRGPVTQSETRFRFILANPGDAAKEVVVTLMLFDIPG
ncbi:hypothetical protein [Rhizobium leguminosarum]|uniref:hypothetical protein n=1 Tax=Rhizobium leguminosarum TaxID=384 RepID=UPI0024B34742|nr:hypothetical protein [Rhizobium leguminosarum]WHO78853.1 hypothetical protein QMO81_001523 [Rhizobium leguminosarum]